MLRLLSPNSAWTLTLGYALFQREYEEFKIRINALVAKAQKVPEEGWTMADGTAWPGNNPRDHPGMIQVPFTSMRLSLENNVNLI